MKAYYVLTQTVTDPQRYFQEYVAKVMPFLAKHGGELLAGELEATPLQGNPAKGAVVLRFPSEEAIRNWLSDPDYQPILKARLSLTQNANAVMVPEFMIPA